ncbi:MAG: phosphatidylinositol transfer protein [Deltaproteobacteria bacterium]|nr:phosphatidylinositol transfer protein [Nannocystaceae bacterium]
MKLRIAALGSSLLLSCGDSDDVTSGGAEGTLGSSGGLDESSSDAGDTGDGGSTAPADSSGGGASSSGSDAESESEGSSSSGGSAICEPPPACDLPPPAPGPLLDWEHTESSFVTNAGGPRHRGRDMFYVPGDPQWVLAKFAYAANDWDLSGERVDIYLQRDCGDAWEMVEIATTTFDDEHATVEGVVDSGGWVFFEMPEGDELALGRHRFWLVVRGDGSSAEVYIDVVEPGTQLVVTDIDGTLTTSESEEFGALLSGSLPDVHPGAVDVMWALVENGYRPFYLTARPDWLGARTREFIDESGLPPGLFHTTLSFDGALGSAAIEYKSAEFDALAARELVPVWVFGNTDSDGAAYEHADVQPLEQRVFFQFDDVHGGRRIDAYADILPELEALDPICE